METINSAITVIILTLMPIAALAGETQKEPPKGWQFMVGAGVIYAPAFAGSQDFQLSAFPNLKVTFSELFFASAKDGVGYNFIHTDGWRAGPIVKY